MRRSAPTLSASVLALLLLGLLLSACSQNATVAPAPAPPPARAAAPTATAVQPIEPALPTSPTVAPPTAPPPTAAPAAQVPATAAPTAKPASPADTSGSDLARAESSGTLRVASTLDNPPFSTFDDQGAPGGFDIALITDLAKRLGFGVEVKDYEFDNLPAVLEQGQADVAIAAISITPERSAQLAFTNAYYVGQDGILAAPESSIADINSLNDLLPLRVGVQKGSLYETWLQENAVGPGKMPAENLVTYPTADQGVLDLAAGNIDAYVLDLQPARAFVDKGQAKLVGEKLYPQVYGIAMRKGSDLLPEINRVLAEAQADGTVEELVEKHLNEAPDSVLPATSVPVATATP